MTIDEDHDDALVREDDDYLLLQPLNETSTVYFRSEKSLWHTLMGSNNAIVTFLEGPYALDILFDYDATPHSTLILFLHSDVKFPLPIQPFTKRRLQNIIIHRVDTPEEMIPLLYGVDRGNVGCIGMAIPEETFWKNEDERNLMGTWKLYDGYFLNSLTHRTTVALWMESAVSSQHSVAICNLGYIPPFVQNYEMIRINGQDVVVTYSQKKIRLTVHEDAYDRRLSWEMIDK